MLTMSSAKVSPVQIRLKVCVRMGQSWLPGLLKTQRAADATACRIARGLVPGAKVEIARLDLGDLATVRDFASRALDKGFPLDVLINNAGARRRAGQPSLLYEPHVRCCATAEHLRPTADSARAFIVAGSMVGCRTFGPVALPA